MANLPADCLTPDEMEWCLQYLMPIVREYGTLGVEQASVEAGRRWMRGREGVDDDE